jgi:hypothetical protein
MKNIALGIAVVVLTAVEGVAQTPSPPGATTTLTIYDSAGGGCTLGVSPDQKVQFGEQILMKNGSSNPGTIYQRDGFLERPARRGSGEDHEDARRRLLPIRLRTRSMGSTPPTPAEGPRRAAGQLLHRHVGRPRSALDVALRRAVPDRPGIVAWMEIRHRPTQRRLLGPERQDLLLQGEDRPALRQQENRMVTRPEGRDLADPPETHGGAL